MNAIRSILTGSSEPVSAVTASTKPNSVKSNGSNEEEDSGRLSKFATCVRQISGTVPFKKKQMFNAPEFDAEAMIESGIVPRMSAKFNALLENIRKADAEDMQNHGKLFKHFIFTDLRKASYGAKAIGSFLQLNGFDIVLKAVKSTRRRKQKDGTYITVPVKKLKVVLEDIQSTEGGSERVGLLQSSPLWKSQMGVDIRKKMLQIFNSRPENIHGEQIRIMVLDSKFKEGIDLYDVKYVHLMEPQITEADLKQAVGRATRYCGQRGLNFVPNVGWKLNVYMYETEFANDYPFKETADGTAFDAHKFMLEHSGMDLGRLEMTRNLTILGIKTAVDYDLTYKINNFKIQNEIFDLTDLKDAIVVEVNPKTGGAVKVIPRIEDIDMKKCKPRANKFFPLTVKFLKEAMRRQGIKFPANANRAWLCEHITQDIVTRLLSDKKIKGDEYFANVRSAKNDRLMDVHDDGAKVVEMTDRKATIITPVEPYKNLFPVPDRKPLSVKDIEDMPDLAEFFAAHEAMAEVEYMSKQSFHDFQAFVASKYAQYGWESPVVKNGCEVAPIPGKAVQFSKSQDFVRHYLTPSSPFRGLLAWHSVGTGKTCTAVATATTEFEKQGYSILWVTRNSLMADVWKNMFGAVCSIPVQEHIAAGKKLPVRLGSQKRLVSKYWFDPISYKTLQNALIPIKKGKRAGAINKLGKALRERNGAADPLHKTFLIIDEVHKLLDGDLKKSEQADFEEIERMIHNSYKVSGQESVKVLLMTATPITDDPNGLFKLLNLLIPTEAGRLPDADTFRNNYTTEAGEITPKGVEMFQNKAKGLISYLNREFDPSAFAQPSFLHVRVNATGAFSESDQELITKCYADEKDTTEEVLDCDVDELKTELNTQLEEVDADEEMKKKDKAEKKRTLKASYKERIDACKAKSKTIKNAAKERARRVGQCVADLAKTRKKSYTTSQQKAMKTCYKKSAMGSTRKFTGVAALKKLAKEGPRILKQTTLTGSRKSTRKSSAKSKSPKSNKRNNTSVKAVRLYTPDD